MRKRLIVAVLMVFLSFAPAYAGHSVVGGFGSYWCECDNPASHNNTLNVSIQNGNEDTQQDSTTELGLLVLFLTALMLRYKA